MRNARGFTLVELLLALAVMASLAVLSWRGLDGMTRAQALTQAHTDQVLTVQAGLAQWAADLDALLDSEDVSTPLNWDGRALRIVRSGTDAGQSGPQVVAWTRRDSAEGGQWLRWQSPVVRTRAALLQALNTADLWAQNPGTEERRREVAIFALTEWRIFFFRGGAWTNPLSSGASTAVGGGAEALPSGVRMELSLPPGQALSGTLVRIWTRPNVAGTT